LPEATEEYLSIATGYRLDGPGMESRWGWDFPHLSRPALGPNSASYTMGTGSFLGVKSGQGMTLIRQSLLVLWSWKSSVIPLFLLWAIWPVQSLSACTRVHFTFTLLKNTMKNLKINWFPFNTFILRHT